jgi:hypothetical protein
MSSHRKVGRSIEEVLVRRKFDSTNPVTWPDGHPSGKTAKISQSLPDLKGEFTAPGTAESREPPRPHIQIVRDITTAAGITLHRAPPISNVNYERLPAIRENHHPICRALHSIDVLAL